MSNLTTKLILVPLVLVGLLNGPCASAASTADGKPTLWASVANRPSTAENMNTPLWNRIKAMVEQVKNGETKAFDKLLASKAKLTLSVGSDNSPITSATIKAAVESCVGPYLYDEGASWVQFSWICRTEQKTALSRFLTFKETPELAVTVWFSASKIQALSAGEPGWIPGSRRVSMGAAEQMSGK